MAAEARAADMMEQTIHSSSSPGHALALAGMDRAVTARVSVTATAAASKVSGSFLTAHSHLVRRHEPCWLRAVVVRRILVDVLDGSGCAHP